MTALEEIAAERRRQIEQEGWSPAHDDTHSSGELALVAAYYCQSAARPTLFCRRPGAAFTVPMQWPLAWHRDWWKPTGSRRDLIKAGALILAEIERLDRRKPEDAMIEPTIAEDETRCIACDEPIEDGDYVYNDESGGIIHADCCGPERESYTGPDGEPLKEGEPIPEPWIWRKDDEMEVRAS